MLTASTQVTFDYRIQLYLWDTANLRASGAALYTSAVRNGSQPASVTGLNLALTPGSTYAAVLTTQGVQNDGFADGFLAFNSVDVYANGSAYQQESSNPNGSSGDGTWTSNAWSASGNGDFQFSAVFNGLATSAPEPGTLALFAAGAAVGLFLKRRKA